MIRLRKIVALLPTILALYMGIHCHAQDRPAPLNRTPTDSLLYPLRKNWISFEVNLILQPVYLFQFGGYYHLNGKKLNIPKSYAPHFYSPRPFQQAFSSIGETADQANSAYASFYLPGFEKSSIPFLHHIRFVFGATHEKLDTDSTKVGYRYYDGGT